jgi:hypothetical protein
MFVSATPAATIADPVARVVYAGNQIPQGNLSTFGNAVLCNGFYPTPTESVVGELGHDDCGKTWESNWKSSSI